jgi:hypothetical protein
MAETGDGGTAGGRAMCAVARSGTMMRLGVEAWWACAKMCRDGDPV